MRLGRFQPFPRQEEVSGTFVRRDVSLYMYTDCRCFAIMRFIPCDSEDPTACKSRWSPCVADRLWLLGGCKFTSDASRTTVLVIRVDQDGQQGVPGSRRMSDGRTVPTGRFVGLNTLVGDTSLRRSEAMRGGQHLRQRNDPHLGSPRGPRHHLHPSLQRHTCNGGGGECGCLRSRSWMVHTPRVYPSVPRGTYASTMAGGTFSSSDPIATIVGARSGRCTNGDAAA